MERKDKDSAVSATCASCGGDPGGLVWEGFVLSGALTAPVIANELFGGALNERAVARLFKNEKLRGLKVGKNWAALPSHFVEDVAKLERGARIAARTPRARRKRVVDIPAKHGATKREMNGRG